MLLFVQVVSFCAIKVLVVALVGRKEKTIMIPGCSFSQFCVTEPNSGLIGLF